MILGRSLDLQGKRVLVFGLGRRGGGEGAVRYLAGTTGALVTVADRLTIDELAPVVRRLIDIPNVNLNLLGSSEDQVDLTGYELMVRNPAVPNHASILDRARALKLPIHTEASIFVHDFPGLIFGVTGSKGKTSTSFFLHHLLGGREGGMDVRLAGNMGGSSLEQLTDATPTTRAVFEFSSFQIETLAECHLNVSVTCLTNLQEDHQDRYNDTAEYWRAKSGLFTLQQPDGWRIHQGDDMTCAYMSDARAQWFSVLSDDPRADASVWIEGGSVWVRKQGRREALIDRHEIPVPDAHRLENVLCAVAGAIIGGVGSEDLRRRLRTLPVIPHRMEPIPLPAGARTWINDTAATNPTSAAAGVRSRAESGSLTVLCGGAPKRLDPKPLVDALIECRAEVVLLPGRESVAIRDDIQRRGYDSYGPTQSMKEAVAIASARHTDIILLSPGCASFATDDSPGFDDEFDRGGQFVEEVLVLHEIPVSDEAAHLLRSPRRGAIADVLSGSGPLGNS